MTSNSEQVPADAFYCYPLGTKDYMRCCTLESVRNNSNSLCNLDVYLEDPETSPCSTGNCLRDCQDLDLLYNLYTGFSTSGSLRNINLYSFCVGIPNMHAYLNQGLIPQTVAPEITKLLPPLTQDDLFNITNALTHCLISTCDQARDSISCTQRCSPGSLLIDSMTPSIRGVSDCLEALCHTDSSSPITSSVPFANSDIAGIGVFTSYFAQCWLAIIAWTILVIIEWKTTSNQSTKTLKHLRQQKERLVTGIVEFHKAQCFFSIPIMVASLFSGIFQENALNVFTLLPLSLNSIAPLQLVLLLITHFAHFSNFLVFLTAVSWILASIVYWTLYRQFPRNPDWAYEDKQAFRDQLVLKLASNPTCGGYSALSFCPNIWGPMAIDNRIARAQSALMYSPWIWSWYTLCMVGVVVKHWTKSGVSKIALLPLSIRHFILRFRSHRSSARIRQHLTSKRVFWAVSIVCVALIVVQLYYLSIAFALSLGNSRDWSFGQIIAVTVWIPPIVEYVQLQINGIILGSRYRFAKNLSLFRSHDTQSDSQQPQTGDSSEAHRMVSNAHGLGQRSPSATSEDESEQPYIPISSSVSATETSVMHDANLKHDDNETFQLRTRSTLRLEEGSENR